MDESVSEIYEIKKIKLVFIGDPSVGKTSLLNRFSKDQFIEDIDVPY